MTVYHVGREARNPSRGFSLRKSEGPVFVEHALSPHKDMPICGFEGQLEVTDDDWYDSTSKNKCALCLERSGG
jgi:hypothetical protein